MGQLLAFATDSSARGSLRPEPLRPEPLRPEPLRPEPLWREVLGRELRRRRLDAGRTLADVAGQAGVSTQYLSEIERGLKEPSSEILGAVHQALGLRLIDLTGAVTRQLGTDAPIAGPVALAV